MKSAKSRQGKKKFQLGEIVDFEELRKRADFRELRESRGLRGKKIRRKQSEREESSLAGEVCLERGSQKSIERGSIKEEPEKGRG